MQRRCQAAEGAKSYLDAILLLKGKDANHVVALDLLLTRRRWANSAYGLADRHRGANRNAIGLRRIDDTVSANVRVQALVSVPRPLRRKGAR